MSNTALITGASAGIGLELAKIHAHQGGDLVLVARSQEKLEALAETLRHAHGVKVAVIVADLAKPEAPAAVFEQVRQLGIQVDVLINNAGFGGHGHFSERALDTELQMVQLNISALTSLTHLFMQGMVERGQGKILNVSSIASFLPGPLQAVYYATKAYVTSFSQAIAEELSGTGVTVTALCPGPVDTGFIAAADLEGVLGLQNTVSAQSVAEFGYQAMQQGKLVAINQRSFKFMLEWVLPLLPRKWVVKVSRKSMEKTA